ncbi:MAG: PAC2 family protein [Mycobacteriales bacterium]
MLDPTDLYRIERDLPPGLDAPIMLQALDGFVDAGQVRHLVRSHLLQTSDAQVVVRFDLDQLLDYRARRPLLTFVEDTWTEYDQPRLEIVALTDAAGTRYLMLSGPEPDIQWDRFSEAVRQVIEHLGVRLTVGLNAIPMGVPHTRPIGMTAHGTRPEIIPPSEHWISTVQVPASAGNLLEYRLGQAGHDAIGFAVHVPHYLSQMPYTPAAEALVTALARATGLELPIGDLTTDAMATMHSINEQVAAAEEVADAVAALESQYDAILRGQGRNLLAEGTTRLPTADELGAELERFLAGRAGPGESAGPAEA